MSKITDLNKAELIDWMKANGEFNKPNTESAAWRHAFKLYEKNQGMKMDEDCSRCWTKVSDWIRL